MFSTLKKAINEFNSLREFKRFAPQINALTEKLTPDELVDFLFSEEWQRFFWMIQVQAEIKALLNDVALLKPSVVVEIGTRLGGTLFLFTKVATDDAQIVSIDYPDGAGGGYSKSRYQFYQMFAVQQQKMDLIRADSHQESTLQQLKSILNGRKIDFLFIDGDHALDGVRMDFEMYAPLVRSGGIVAFHDIKDTPEHSWSGVIPFWASIKDKYKHKEYNSAEANWGGIGVITLP